MAYILPSKQFDGCKDAKGLNLDQFQNDSWLYGKTFITISKFETSVLENKLTYNLTTHTIATPLMR
jgi:hypothetical protein